MDRQLVAYSSDPFRHEHLDDASKQIRLLELEPGAWDSELSCSMRSFLLDGAPPYAAMSYTWGPPQPTRRIIVNGRSLDVRQNCYMALQQAREYRVFEHHWIDSIAIDQSNTTEKSQQVALMAHVYKQAACVLASLGSQTFRLGSICACLREFEERWEEALDAFPEQPESLARSVVNSMNERKYARLCRYFHSITSLPYWTRLWIVQELRLAREVKLLLGKWAMDWRSLKYLRGALYDRFNVEQPHGDRVIDVYGQAQTFDSNGHFSRIVNSGDETRDLVAMLNLFAKAECTDVRDRIFGLLSMTHYSPHVDPIQPDYGQSACELAVKAVSHCIRPYQDFTFYPLWSDATKVLCALKLHWETPDIAVAIRNRQHVHALDSPTMKLRDTDANRFRVDVRPGLCYKLSAGHEGDLEAADMHYRVVSRVHEFEGGVPGLEFHIDGRDRPSPQPLLHGTKVVGYVCPQARPGDYVVMLQIRSTVSNAIGLVVRNYEQQECAIVGQCLSEFDISLGMQDEDVIDDLELDSTLCEAEKCPQLQCHDTQLPKPGFRVWLSAEDLLVFIGQDLSPDLDIGTVLEGYVGRLTTGFTGSHGSSYAEIDWRDWDQTRTERCTE